MKKNDNLRFAAYYVLPLLIYCVFILYMSSFSAGYIADKSDSGGLFGRTENALKEVHSFEFYRFGGGLEHLNSYVKHAAAYFMLGFFVFRLMQNTASCRLWIVAVILFGLFFSIIDEMLQSFVPGRMPDVFDVLSDAFGSVLFVYFRLVYDFMKKNAGHAFKACKPFA